MKIIKSMIVAFSIYSKIPMPRFEWKSDDMKYHLCFFPLVGAVIGAFEWLWLYLAQLLQIGEIGKTAIFGAIILGITGGFHLDGYMDTMDGIHSYQNQEKKLEILKDPHIGAFSVICLLLYVLVGMASFTEIKDEKGLLIVCICFFISRAMSGISVVTMKSAKGNGMLATFSDTAEKKRVLAVLVIELLAGFCLAGMVCLRRAVIIFLISLGSYLFYARMSKRQFGGITGDLAGFFVTVTELLYVCGMAITSIAPIG